MKGAPEGVGILLRKLRGEDIDWQAFRECRSPTAICSKCEMQRDISHFTDAEWELARAIRPATCIVCTDSVIGERRKRDLKTAKPIHPCASCKHSKIMDAFPRAQLEQADAITKQICLKCLQAQQQFWCNLCKTSKDKERFQPQVLTLATQRACLDCQPGPRERKKGWSTCRACSAVVPTLRAPEGKVERCLNCKSRGTRMTNVHTCKRCSQKFSSQRTESEARERYCPKCRNSC